MKSHEIFESNPDLKEVHVTSDGTPFYNANDAKQHAKTLKDKSVELVVNPSVLDVIVDDADSDELENDDQLQTAEGIKGEMIGLDAQPDGSVNVLSIESTGGTPLGDLTTLSADETKDLIQAGGEAIKAPEVSTVEAPKAEAPAAAAPAVETPKATSKNSK